MSVVDPGGPQGPGPPQPPKMRPQHQNSTKLRPQNGSFRPVMIWGLPLIKSWICPCMYTLFTVIQESKFMREYIWYFGYYFAKIFAWKVFLFCTKIVQKTFLFPTEQVTIQCPQENSPKTTFKPKSSHFSLLFCQKVIFNYNNSIQTSCRNHLYLWPHFTIL